jgi:hypothetical protein
MDGWRFSTSCVGDWIPGSEAVTADGEVMNSAAMTPERKRLRIKRSVLGFVLEEPDIRTGEPPLW